MPDEITIKPKSDSPVGDRQENRAEAWKRSQLICFCAAGLAVSFFLPWASFWLGTPSGFDLQKAGDGQLLLWLIPIGSVVTIITCFIKSGQGIAARITGALPFLAGAYWYSKMGSDLFHIMTYGAYLSLAFGVALLLLPFMKTSRQP